MRARYANWGQASAGGRFERGEKFFAQVVVAAAAACRGETGGRPRTAGRLSARGRHFHERAKDEEKWIAEHLDSQRSNRKRGGASDRQPATASASEQTATATTAATASEQSRRLSGRSARSAPR